MASTTDLQDRLQAEFCPPLDTSLIAALVGDISSNNTISDAQLHELRTTLSELAAQAEEDDLLASALSSSHLPPERAPTTEDDASSSLPELSTDTGATSLTSDPSPDASSALAFLQAAFPHIDAVALRQALGSAGGAADADMEDVVAALLSAEAIRELAERDLAPGEEAEYASEWVAVGARKPKAAAQPRPKKAKPRTMKLVDVRQMQHAPPPARGPGSPRPAPDPWIQNTSLATRVAELVPPHPPSVFLSALHSPSYSTPAHAIRGALASLTSSPLDDPSAEGTATLFGMLDVLTASSDYDALDAEQRDQLVSDAQLALRVSDGRPEDALELVWLLRELEEDRTAYKDMGVYHSPAPSAPGTPTSPMMGRGFVSLPVPKPATKISNGTSAQNDLGKHKVPDTAWHAVPVRKGNRESLHAAFIPAYGHRGSNGRTRGAGNALGKGGKGDVGELSSSASSGGGGAAGARARARELRTRRDAALREASRQWARGNARSRGGEVAFYFAERARELQEAARGEALRAARGTVDAKRKGRGTRDIDLHGTMAAEAVVIVRDILDEEGSSSMEPLTIITGKGTHSTGGVGVLGPAVRNALVQDGWHVRQRDGALTVHGKSSVRVR